jgi:hypothetical protein
MPSGCQAAGAAQGRLPQDPSSRRTISKLRCGTLQNTEVRNCRPGLGQCKKRKESHLNLSDRHFAISGVLSAAHEFSLIKVSGTEHRPTRQRTESLPGILPEPIAQACTPPPWELSSAVHEFSLIRITGSRHLPLLQHTEASVRLGRTLYAGPAWLIPSSCFTGNVARQTARGSHLVRLAVEHSVGAAEGGGGFTSNTHAPRSFGIAIGSS